MKIILLSPCLCLPSQDFICEHYGEDSFLYDKEIKELMELRQVNKFTHTVWSRVNILLIMGRKTSGMKSIDLFKVDVSFRLCVADIKWVLTFSLLIIQSGHAYTQSKPGRSGAANGVLQSAVLPGSTLLLCSEESGCSFPLVLYDSII